VVRGQHARYRTGRPDRRQERTRVQHDFLAGQQVNGGHDERRSEILKAQRSSRGTAVGNICSQLSTLPGTKRRGNRKAACDRNDLRGRYRAGPQRSHQSTDAVPARNVGRIPPSRVPPARRGVRARRAPPHECECHRPLVVSPRPGVASSASITGVTCNAATIGRSGCAAWRSGRSGVCSSACRTRMRATIRCSMFST